MPRLGYTLKRPQFVDKGACHGINLIHRHPNEDAHVLVKLFTEDDGIWHEQSCFSSAWLPELIELLQNVQNHLERHGIPDK